MCENALSNIIENNPFAGVVSRAKAFDENFGRGTVFDIGANVGQSFQGLRQAMPEALIHCFEPATETFSKLQAATAGDKHVACFRQGLGSFEGRSAFSVGRDTGNQRLASKAQTPAQTSREQTEIEIATGDKHCRTHAIEQVDFLKIDTEGYDLDVLVGFGVMLRQGRIAYLQVECTTSLDNRFHVHLERFIHFLHPYGYRMSDLLEPHRRVNVTRQNLRGMWFCNAVFAREVDAPRLRRDGQN